MASDNSIQPIYDGLAVLRREWVMSGWSWDGRLSCVCSSFGADYAEKALGALDRSFAQRIEQRGLTKSHQLIQQAAENSGGMRPDQLIFASQPVAGTIAYGLWWPWGDDVTISFRVGLSGLHAGYELANLQLEFNAAE